MAKISKRSMKRRGGADGNSTMILLAAGAVMLVVVILLIVSSSSSSSSSVETGGIDVKTTPPIKQHNKAPVEAETKDSGNLRSGGNGEDDPSKHAKPQEVKLDDPKTEAKAAVHSRSDTPPDVDPEDPPEALDNAHIENHGDGLPNDHQTMYFHHYKKGKAGAIIEDMLMCHAYAFHTKGDYGGICGKIKPDKLAQYESLLDAMGLKEALPFACPSQFRRDSTTRRSMVPRELYRKDDVRIWTPDYVDFLKSQVKYPPKKDDRFTIAVHIRRGEVTPCRLENQGFERYLSNLHFQMVIDKYYQEGARVIIFSNEESYEPWDDFRKKGYELELDGEITDAWKTFVTADLVILSRSSFSFIPAMVAKGKVIYTPYWHKPLRRWVHVDKEIMEKSDAETERLQLACPKTNKFGGKVLSHEVGHHKEAHQKPPDHHDW